ncbi:hypothetical protein ACGFNV_06380 [Streptomyces sp. NPDC048751]|uniref:hypothetical protein n=1 Tax=Streptomyces sp. NPDC048751 TaxID=3365591 RepID=UPI0037131C0D
MADHRGSGRTTRRRSVRGRPPVAEAGLLTGLPATTHSLTADQLAAQHPDINVDPEPIFIRAGRIWTCAGVTAAMDLALAMVAEDHGPAIALDAVFPCHRAPTGTAFVRTGGGRAIGYPENSPAVGRRVAAVALPTSVTGRSR